MMFAEGLNVVVELVGLRGEMVVGFVRLEG